MILTALEFILWILAFGGVYWYGVTAIDKALIGYLRTKMKTTREDELEISRVIRDVTGSLFLLFVVLQYIISMVSRL